MEVILSCIKRGEKNMKKVGQMFGGVKQKSYLCIELRTKNMKDYSEEHLILKGKSLT